MELPMLIVFGLAVAVIVFFARPGARKLQRSSNKPRLWDSTPGAAPLFAPWLGGDSGSTHSSIDSSHHSSHDGGGYDGGTNAPSRDGGGGGADGGGGF